MENEMDRCLSRLIAAGIRLAMVARNERSQGKWCTVCGAVKKGQRYDHLPGCPVAEMEAAIYEATQKMIWRDALEAASSNRGVTPLCGLSVRTRKACDKLGVTTFEDLSNKTPDELKAAGLIGETSLFEIRAVLSERGLLLKHDSNTMPEREGQ